MSRRARPARATRTKAETRSSAPRSSVSSTMARYSASRLSHLHRGRRLVERSSTSTRAGHSGHLGVRDAPVEAGYGHGSRPGGCARRPRRPTCLRLEKARARSRRFGGHADLVVAGMRAGEEVMDSAFRRRRHLGRLWRAPPVIFLGGSLQVCPRPVFSAMHTEPRHTSQARSEPAQRCPQQSRLPARRGGPCRRRPTNRWIAFLARTPEGGSEDHPLQAERESGALLPRRRVAGHRPCALTIEDYNRFCRIWARSWIREARGGRDRHRKHGDVSRTPADTFHALFDGLPPEHSCLGAAASTISVRRGLLLLDTVQLRATWSGHGTRPS